jgi:sugar-specific transcriptional regulator TrmB
MQILEEIGLTKKEAEVYQTLLRLGNSPVSKVLAATGSHPQVIYRVIDTLEKKGLLTVTTRKSRKFVRAEDPKTLEVIEKKRLENLVKALPELSALQKTPADAIIKVSRGDEAVRSLRMRGMQELTAGGTYYVIGASGNRYYDVMGQEGLKAFERKRVRKKIIMKLIAFRSQKEMIEKQNTIPKFTDFRYLSEEYAVFSSTNILNDTVAILIWSADPIVITIESAEVADSYRQYFSSLWKHAAP